MTYDRWNDVLKKLPQFDVATCTLPKETLDQIEELYTWGFTRDKKQIEQDRIFLNIAKDYSKFSKCQFTKVGAIAVNENGRIIATGVNGTLPGTENCCSHTFAHREDHVPYTRDNELHAEANLILEMVKMSVKFEELTIYLTISPCPECLKLLLGLNRKDKNVVKRIVYAERYHRQSDSDIEAMKQRAAKHHTLLQHFEYNDTEIMDLP